MCHPCKQCSWWGCSWFSGVLPQSWAFFQKEWDFLTCCLPQAELPGYMPEIRPWQRKPRESWWCPCLHPKIPGQSACFLQNCLWLLVESSRVFNCIWVRRWKGRMDASLFLWVEMSRCYFFCPKWWLWRQEPERACVYVVRAGQGWVVEGKWWKCTRRITKGDKVYAGMRAEKWEAGERVGQRSSESNQRVTL